MKVNMYTCLAVIAATSITWYMMKIVMWFVLLQEGLREKEMGNALTFLKKQNIKLVWKDER